MPNKGTKWSAERRAKFKASTAARMAEKRAQKNRLGKSRNESNTVVALALPSIDAFDSDDVRALLRMQRKHPHLFDGWLD